MLLIERLQKALGPEYEVERELAGGGGMGVVFLATHRRLARRVAIKVLRPELATAIAAERFVAEGRTLATLAPHPNIVSVYDAKENGGLVFFVMEFVEGETLASRLERGPLAPDDVVRLAGDLLAALGAAHAQHIVHRDVKPANIFLRQGRALLGDFGIARWRETNEPGLTTPGQLIGTLRYMSPEQQEGEPVTALTDVYAAALVLYEACTGQRWPAYQAPEQGEWRDVPPALATPMRRALALTPADRWSDGKAFGQAMTAQKRPVPRTVIAVGVVVLAIVGVLRLMRPPRPEAPAGVTMTLAIARFEVLGAAGAPGVGESVAAAVREALAGFVDFFVPPRGSSDDTLAVRVTGTAETVGDRLQLTLTARDPRRPATQLIGDSLSGNSRDWHRLADSLALRLVRNLFLAESTTDRWLPRGAIPEGSRGLALWLNAEQYLARADWEKAERAYLDAEAADTTCYLCSFRLHDIDRWLDYEHDSTRIQRLGKALGKFPPHYQRLIHAALAPLPGRLDTLAQAARDYPDFFLAPFEYGDELFHRGPFFGMSRSDAQEHLERAVNLRPWFGPGWEHLAWLLLSEGDSAAVATALDSLNNRPASPGFSKSLRVLFLLGQAWKFFPPDVARGISRQVLADPQIKANKDAAAGARLLMTTDAPFGAVEFGRLLAAVDWPARSGAVRGGLLGQLFGFAALGRLDSMRAVGTRLNSSTKDRALPLLAWELEAVLRLFDPDSSVQTDPDVIRALDTYASGGVSVPLRNRAAWMRGLLSARSGDTAGAAAMRRLLAGRPASARKLRILDALILASHGQPVRALAALPQMPSIPNMPGQDDGPLEDVVVRLLRAEWQEQSGDRAGALATLLWHEHLWTIGHLTSDPQPGELGWAVGTLARWRRVPLLGPADGIATRCAELRAIERRWKYGQAPFARRADSAGGTAKRVCQ